MYAMKQTVGKLKRLATGRFIECRQICNDGYRLATNIVTALVTIGKMSS